MNPEGDVDVTLHPVLLMLLLLLQLQMMMMITVF